MNENRPGKRYSALIEFKGETRIVDDIRARDLAHAWELVERRRKTFFRQFQIPQFQRRSYRVLGLFYGSIRFATE